MRSLAPRTEIREQQVGKAPRRVMVSVVVRYERIMNLLSGSSDVIQKYRRELLGSANAYVTPDLYNSLSLGKELLGDAVAFYRMLQDPAQVKMAAKLIAQVNLKNMVEVVDRHDMLQAQKAEKYAKGKK